MAALLRRLGCMFVMTVLSVTMTGTETCKAGLHDCECMRSESYRCADGFREEHTW